jgi:hypothetical protein
LISLASQLCTAIRDSVNLSSRKPFHWGGLLGYQRLEVIAAALHRLAGTRRENDFFRRVREQVERTVAQNRALATQLQQAHHWLGQVAACLHFPATSYSEQEWQTLSSQQVAQDMRTLLQQLSQATQTAQPPLLARFHSALQRRWQAYGSELLHCYDIPGLPAHNLQLESFFNRLRRHQRRISGRQSTQELRDFGQFQALFLTKSYPDLLHQLQQVPLPLYQKYRQRLANSEAPRRFLHHLHRDPGKTIHCLLDRYAQRQLELALPHLGTI